MGDVRVRWFLIGWVAILLLKYVVVGLDTWNATLHPGLVIAPNQMAYRRPLLGLFG
jgi:hypothetical protein